jgi:hypothetical protein
MQLINNKNIKHDLNTKKSPIQNINKDHELSSLNSSEDLPDPLKIYQDTDRR